MANDISTIYEVMGEQINLTMMQHMLKVETKAYIKEEVKKVLAHNAELKKLITEEAVKIAREYVLSDEFAEEVKSNIYIGERCY